MGSSQKSTGNSIAAAPIARAKNCRIRSRLLQNLGIETDPATTARQYQSHQHRAASEVSAVVEKGKDNAFEEALKGDNGKSNACLERDDRASTLPPSRKTTRFDATVKVHPIPARSSYSNRMRAQLWTTSSEIQQNAARNCIEFAAEGWNWQHVADDNDMVLYDGELIHPIHFVRQQQDQPSE